MREFGPVGSLFCIPLSATTRVVGQVTQSHGVSAGFGILDRLFSDEECRALESAELSGVKRFCYAYTRSCKEWVDLAIVLPLLDEVRARYLRWSDESPDGETSAHGYFLVEKDPVDDDYEVWTEVRELPAYMTEAHHYDAVEIPQLLERSLRERWGISDSTSRRGAGVKDAQVVGARDDLLASSSVAQVCDDAEQRGPRWARRRLAMAAGLALETTGYLDAEIGGPALAAACATRDAQLARAFRSTTKTVKAAVDRPKAVARRVLDPQTSELAELHRDAGTLEALEEYVEGLGLDDATE